MAKKADILWKGILEDVFEDFLCFIYPKASNIIDFSKDPEFLDKELEQVFPPEKDQFSPKVVDKLVKLRTYTGEEEWVLLHIEVQGRYDSDFNKRMLRYYYRILDKYQKPITAFVIFTESTTLDRINHYERNFMGTRLFYQFNTLKISQQKDEDLLASDNPFALVVLSAKTAFCGKKLGTDVERDRVLRELKLTIVKALHAKGHPEHKITKIMNFLRFYVNFETEEINNIFEQDIQTITEKTTTMGIEELLLARAKHEGLKEGEKKGAQKERDRAVEEKKEVAQILKQNGVELSIIAKSTRLPLSLIQSL